jgi:CheY-like chemotaxis protein
MPALDGYDATAHRRHRETGTEHTPAIAMRARAMGGDHERCLDGGIDDYISSPMRHDALAETLRRWIRELAREG